MIRESWLDREALERHHYFYWGKCPSSLLSTRHVENQLRIY
jgi:hypothetical protein